MINHIEKSIKGNQKPKIPFHANGPVLKRQITPAGKSKIATQTMLPSAGTYFALADYSAISDKNGVDFCEELTREHGVAAIPQSVFYKTPPNSRIIRFCFAKREQTLLDASAKLCAL